MDRAKRGKELEPWALNPQRPDSGSVLALDNEDFEDHSPNGVSGPAVFAIMGAVDCLATMQLIAVEAAKKPPFNHHTSTFMALCRNAAESSAQAIWILEDPDREVRRRRTAGVSRVGLQYQVEFLTAARDAHDSKVQTFPGDIDGLRERLKFAEAELIEIETCTPSKRARRYMELVNAAAVWVENHVPEHSKAEFDKVHFPSIAKTEYNLTSAFTHGNSWPTDFAHAVDDLFRMMADGIAFALHMTEVAVCLFEALATNSGSTPTRTRRYPARMQPTVNQYAALYV